MPDYKILGQFAVNQIRFEQTEEVTHEESPAGDDAIWVSEAFRGSVGLATEATAVASSPVETTCSATRAPAAISAIVMMMVGCRRR